MTILVVGSTGDLGGRVARLLMDKGQRVRCLVRPQTPADGLESAGAEIARGDLTDPSSLDAACRGVDVVVTTATAIGRLLGGAKGPSIREVDEVGTLALVRAAEQAGVDRFVYTSYAGVEAGIRFPLEEAKLAVENRLHQSFLRTCLIRPDAFQDVHLAPVGRFDVRAGKVGIFGKGQGRRRWVAVADVAALISAVAVEDDPPAVVEFGGPEALSRNEVVAIAERLTGRSFKRQRIPAGVAEVGVRLLSGWKPAVASVFGLGLLLDRDATWDDSPLRQRGIEPRSTTAWVEQQVSA
jgi:uncharacterized protein YbjT (DUF2867 family)